MNIHILSDNINNNSLFFGETWSRSNISDTFYFCLLHICIYDFNKQPQFLKMAMEISYNLAHQG